MSKITITEALAELPTIEKRIEKKREFIMAFVYRQASVRDPHEKNGGSATLIANEEQAIHDLTERVIKIRSAIQKANAENSITIGKQTRTVGDWLVWKREIAPILSNHYQQISRALGGMRMEAQRKGFAITTKDEGFSSDIVVNINEKDFADDIENLEIVLGTLDGQLSLKNATTTIDI